jgi:hypothetical protein
MGHIPPPWRRPCPQQIARLLKLGRSARDIAIFLGKSLSVIEYEISSLTGEPTPDDPSPDVIAQRIAEIQAGWDESTRDLAFRGKPRLSSLVVASRRPRPAIGLAESVGLGLLRSADADSAQVARGERGPACCRA